MRLNKQDLITKQQLPARPGVVISGRLGDDFVEIHCLTERYAGDTHLNEKRRICGAVIYTPNETPAIGWEGSQAYHALKLDERTACKLFDYDGWGYPQ